MTDIGMLTRKRDLRTGSPVWAAERKPGVGHTPLLRELETEVLVIGAGVSGALIAETLTAAGMKVTVVDRRSPLAGSTSASTALLQSALDTPLTHLARSIGPRAAEQVWRRSRLVVNSLVERTQRLGIDADLVARDSVYLTGDLLDAKGLEREARARARIGLEVAVLGRAQLRSDYGLRRSGALLGCGDYVAEPRKLAAGYLRVAAERGTEVFAPVDVVSVKEQRAGVVATTSHGLRIRARHVVFATGYEVACGLKATGHSIQSSWVIATQPQRRHLWPTECMIWEAADPYLYVRTTPEGRVICGGADEPFSDAERRDARSAQKHAYLARQLKRLLPELDATVQYAWAGTFGTSDRGTPIIGRLPGTRRQSTVLGCGGNGITFSMLGAQIIRGLITGDEDRDAELFAPRR